MFRIILQKLRDILKEENEKRGIVDIDEVDEILIK